MNSEDSRKTINNGERHLPLELVENILFRQTVEDLLRCRCVCKPWKTLIDSYRFKNNLFQAAKRSISTLFIWRNSVEPTLHLCYPHSDHNLSFQLALNLGQFLDDSAFDSSDIMISSYGSGANNLCFNKFGVVNGLVYLGWNSFHVIWNPCTKQFNRFNAPKKNWEFDLIDKCGICEEILLNDEICAFGFDPISQDYKFLMAYFACEMRDAPPKVKNKVLCELYSMKNNSWKEFIIDFPNVSGIVTGDGYMDDGKFYWFAKKCGSSANPAVITFDFHNEVFDRMSLPEELVHGENAVAVANRGGLEIIMTFGNAGGVEDLRGEVWAVGNDGEWRKTLTVNLPSNIGRPVGLLKEGEIMFESPSHIDGFKELLIFNPDTSLRKNLGFVGTKLWVFNYVQSLFSVKL